MDLTTALYWITEGIKWFLLLGMWSSFVWLCLVLNNLFTFGESKIWLICILVDIPLTILMSILLDENLFLSLMPLTIGSLITLQYLLPLPKGNLQYRAHKKCITCENYNLDSLYKPKLLKCTFIPHEGNPSKNLAETIINCPHYKKSEERTVKKVREYPAHVLAVYFAASMYVLKMSTVILTKVEF